jgi:two-component system, sensor histidine kinase and response regulator
MSNYSILVVDDEPDNFETIEAMLDGKNYNLHYVSCGREALDALDVLKPNLILLDAMMPEMDGIEVCQRIKAIPQWQSVPIVMVTALSGKADLSRCLSMGADDFICKPIEPLELRARVQSMLRIEQQHDRIQALSLSQQNSIHSLENSLNEFRLDLAAGFPNELNVSLSNILEQIETTQKSLDRLSRSDVSKALRSIQRSTHKLNRANQKFLFYLQLNLSIRDNHKNCVCSPKNSIEQIANSRAAKVKSLTRIIFDVEDVKIAVAPEHWQYIINELMDNTLNMSRPEIPIYIHGRISEDLFHFWIDDRELATGIDSSMILSELIQFDPGLNECLELEIGLKIAKKIVEIYDGLLLIGNTNREYTTIYITLPLATSTVDPTGQIGGRLSSDYHSKPIAAAV